MIPGSGRSPGEGKGYPFQYSGLENSMDCIVQGVVKSWTQLSDFHFHTYIVTYSLSLSLSHTHTHRWASTWLSGKESACNAGDARVAGLIPGSGRSPGGGNGNPLRCSCLETPWAEEPGWIQSVGSHRVGHD